MSERIVIDLDRDGWTKNLQLNIAKLNENDRGMGFRLAGPKYNGSSTNLLRTELDERDAAEIRAMLDAVFPVAPGPTRAEVLAEAIAAIDAKVAATPRGRGVDGALRRGMAAAADLLRHLTDEEKDTAPAATSTPRPAEIKFVGSPAPITLTGWALTELAPDYYGHTYMQLDGWLPANLGRDEVPGGTTQLEYAHLHERTVPAGLNVQVEVKGYGEPSSFIKIQWRKDGAA
ncbi:hypothetical protein ACPXCP_31090 [Streptomyces sp. DT20]|uniref:hypothetical protein n=1 Tax=Streptomyces sp. DT20 TaxID=3416519 RepID=UPI003CFB44F2